WLTAQEENDGKRRCNQSERRQSGLDRAGRRHLWAGAGQRGSAVGGGEALSRFAAPGHTCHQESQAGRWIGQEAVEAEGHGSRAYRFGAFASLASWRYGAWTAAAQL